ncbi:MAG: hypothetical protein V5A44_09640, partial [Haloarculaceae archaeon]
MTLETKYGMQHAYLAERDTPVILYLAAEPGVCHVITDHAGSLSKGGAHVYRLKAQYHGLQAVDTRR